MSGMDSGDSDRESVCDKPPLDRFHPVDVHIGNRLRQRRLLVGLSQEELAKAVGVAFQQIQKYEHAVNRVSISRLWDLSFALQCPVTYFFGEMEGKVAEAGAAEPGFATKHETLKLVRAYFTIRHPAMRRQILDLASSLSTLRTSHKRRELKVEPPPA